MWYRISISNMATNIPRMTEQTYNERADKLLDGLPYPVKSAIHYWAYENGHAYGLESCLEYIDGLSDVIDRIKLYMVPRGDK